MSEQLITGNLSLQDLEDLHTALHVCLYQWSQSSNDPSKDPQWHRLVALDRQVTDAIQLRKTKTKNTLRI